MYVRAAGLSAPGAEVDARGRDNFCSVGVRVQGVKVVRRRVAFVARYVLGAREERGVRYEAHVNAAYCGLGSARTCVCTPDCNWSFAVYR